MGLISLSFLFHVLGMLIAIGIAAYVYLKHVTYNYWRNQGIGQANPLVPFGNMWPIISAKISIGECLRDLYLQSKDKPVFGFYAFHKPTLVIRDPDLVRFVLTKEFSHFQNRGVYSNEKVDPLSANLFMLPGEKWRHLRVKFTPTFTSGKMKYMFATVKECSDNLAQCVAEEMKNKEFIEVKDIMARFTTDVIASVAFGIECNSLRNPDAEFRARGREFMASKPINNALMMMCPSLLELFHIATTPKNVTNFVINTFKKTVEYRTLNNIVRKDFLDLVMQLMNKGYVQRGHSEETLDESEANTEKITMLQGAAQVLVFWVAGFETSASTATHCLYELAINQGVQEKLADEIDRVLEEFGGLTYESLNAMPYLQRVVSETLRKYPSLPILNRECSQDTDLPGTSIRIKKGTPIFIPIWGLHLNPDIYPEPDKFDPERFSKENIASRHRYAYLPFGDGPRNCIGMRFGLMQVQIGLVSLLSKFRFEVGPDTPVPLPVDKGNFLICPRDGLPLLVTQR